MQSPYMYNMFGKYLPLAQWTMLHDMELHITALDGGHHAW